MYINLTGLAPGWAIAGWVGLSFFILYALSQLSLRSFHKSALIAVLPAFVACMLLLWLMKAGLHEGMEIHLLGLTALTIMAGVPLATLCVFILYILLALLGKISWLSIGMNSMLVGILPIMISAYIHQLVYKKLPNNYFVYLFVSGFLNSAFVLIITMASLGLFLALSGSYDITFIRAQYLQLTLLLVFPEAFINGAVLSVLAIYRPQWVLGFDQDKYLSN